MDSAKKQLQSPTPGPGAPAAVEFAQLYEQFFPFVWRSAKRLGVSPAAQDDVCQEVFVVVYRKLPEFRGESSLKTWIFGILTHVVSTHRRTQQRKEPALRSNAPLVDVEHIVADQHHDPHERAVQAQNVQVAQELFLSLSEDKRVLLMLADLEDVPVTEIAQLTGMNLNTTHARLRAARQALAEAVRRYRARTGGVYA